MSQPRHARDELNNWPQLIGHPYDPTVVINLKRLSRQHIKSPLTMLGQFLQMFPQEHFKTHNPVFNIPYRNESVVPDTVMGDTLAFDDGSTMVQFFCGHETLVCNVFGIKNLKQFVNTLLEL